MPKLDSALKNVHQEIAELERERRRVEGALAAARERQGLLTQRLWGLIGEYLVDDVEEHFRVDKQTLLIDALRSGSERNNKDLAQLVFGASGPKEQNRLSVMLTRLKKTGKVEKTPGGWRAAG